MAAALDNVPSADLSDTKMVGVAEALSKHDLHVVANVPACLIAHFGVVKTALDHDQAGSTCCSCNIPVPTTTRKRGVFNAQVF